MRSAPPDPERIFNEGASEALVEEIWQYQCRTNAVMKRMRNHLGRGEPFFFPVRFFRDFRFVCDEPADKANPQPELVFRSSGTTGQSPSVHYVKTAGLYRSSALKGFRHFFGGERFSIFALLPGYLERPDASLVFMVKTWMEEFGNPCSGFFLSDFSALQNELSRAAEKGERILLIGVSFALLDFAAECGFRLPPGSVVMETGGMKGRRKELVRTELHDLLQKGFGADRICSEYGMTEMLSQAYALEAGRFRCPPWLKVVVTDLHHPWKPAAVSETGRINLIDLANLHSCSFLRTDDLGRLLEDGSFEVLGRIDHSELRGCSLMYE